MVAPSRASANTAAASEGGFVRHCEQTWFGTAARGIPSMGDERPWGGGYAFAAFLRISLR